MGLWAVEVRSVRDAWQHFATGNLYFAAGVSVGGAFVAGEVLK
jgi:hypothetical protein